MRAVIQRVGRTVLSVDGQLISAIKSGLAVYLGIGPEDEKRNAESMAKKIAQLRIFEDEQGKLNLSAQELGLEALVVSNFTLYADTKKGRRPSFVRAAKPPLADGAYDRFVEELRKTGLAGVQTGTFGADMQIELVNEIDPTVLGGACVRWGSRQIDGTIRSSLRALAAELCPAEGRR